MPKYFYFLGFLLFSILLSCDRNNLPQTEYFEKVDNRYVPVFVKYKDQTLWINDTVINNLQQLRYYISDLPDFQYNTRHITIALEIENNIAYSELDSIFRLLSEHHFIKIFFLVNNVKDTVGFNLILPIYNGKFILPDTLRYDNIICYRNDSIFLNEKKLDTRNRESQIKKIVFNKEKVSLYPDQNTKYESIIEIFEIYTKSQQHFKEIYSELHFNKKYHWLIDGGIQKNEVDEEYRNRLSLGDPEIIKNREIIIKND